MTSISKNWAYNNRYYIGGGIALGVVLATYYWRNDAKKLAKDMFGGQVWFEESLKWYRDGKTKKIVDELHPKFSPIIKEFFSIVEKKLGLQMYATSGYRTFKEQEALHKQNSSNAKAGYSNHNFGFAIDVNVIDKNGKIILKKDSSSKSWIDSGVIDIANKLGLSWGGNGTFGNYHDPVHFYIDPKGMNTAKLLALHNSNKVDNKGYVIV